MIFTKKQKTKELLAESQDSSVAQWIEAEPEVEGQLAIDVYQTTKKIIIKSTIAGAKPKDLKISLHNDLLSIKGYRQLDDEIEERDYLYRECYWGSFSRSIILPSEVDNKKVEAELENGILTITLYKTYPEEIKVKSKD